MRSATITSTARSNLPKWLPVGNGGGVVTRARHRGSSTARARAHDHAHIQSTTDTRKRFVRTATTTTTTVGAWNGVRSRDAPSENRFECSVDRPSAAIFSILLSASIYCCCCVAPRIVSRFFFVGRKQHQPASRAHTAGRVLASKCNRSSRHVARRDSAPHRWRLPALFLFFFCFAWNGWGAHNMR